MLDGVRGSVGDGDYVDFLTAGTRAAGQYRCTDCGYGVTIHSELPRCPMCGGSQWEEAAWSPLTRALDRL